MRFAQTDSNGADPEAPRGLRRITLLPGLRLLIAAYGLGSLGLGYLRLRAEDFSRHALADVLTVWYAEALVFLAVFGGAAAIMGVVTRGPKEPRRRKRPADPLSNTTLASLERHR